MDIKMVTNIPIKAVIVLRGVSHYVLIPLDHIKSFGLRPGDSVRFTLHLGEDAVGSIARGLDSVVPVDMLASPVIISKKSGRLKF